MLSVLKNRDYRLLFIGQAASQVGDQFNLIALPWLVLALTRDPLHLGLVLATAGAPRAALMLFGGVFADRHSPRTIMLVSDALRFVLTSALAAAIVAGVAQLWMVYVLAVVFGIVGGFCMPAAESMAPRLVDDGQLESANSLVMGAGQLAGFVGPAAAGLLIAAFGTAAGGTSGTAALPAIGLAFGLDAASFLVSGLSLALMGPVRGANAETRAHPLSDVAEGLRYAWGTERIRWMVVLIGLANFLIAGPVFVGMPVLAQSRLAGGAAALGAILSSAGLGSLLGMVAAAATRRPSDRVFSWMVVGLMSGFGLSMLALAFVHATWIAAALMFATGLGNGYIAVSAMSSVQRMTEERLLGRVMSLIMLAIVGLTPASQAVAGVAMRLSPEAVFGGAGVGFAMLALIALAKRGAWSGEPGGGQAAGAPSLALRSAS